MVSVKDVLKGLGNRSLGGLSTGAPSDPTPVISTNDHARRLELLDDFERAGIGWFWATDGEGRLIYLSESAVRNLGRSDEELLSQPLNALFETDPDNRGERSDRPLNFQLSARSKLIDVTVRFMVGAPRHARRQTWWLISGHPKFDEAGQFLGYRGSAKDISVEYERKREDSRLAEYDSLTGLANRHRMNKLLETTLAAYRVAKRSCALMMLDLDRFKQVNDTMGHQAGDALLLQVAERLKGVVGELGEVGRLGGDEFQIMLPDLDDRGTLGEIAREAIHVVSQPYPIDGKHAIVGASIGVAIAPYDGIDRADLIHSSDLALYAAKNGGRGQFRFYSADLKIEEEERRLLMDDLRVALTNDELDLHYQPVVRTRDNVVVGVEALMRWNHPERGAISPAVFIPIAEETNLITQLGEWALRRACEDAALWPEAIRVAVNVSALQFVNPAFPTVVASALSNARLAPNRLELELTESVFMGDSAIVDASFQLLKQLGVRLALDDFGTGFSSLSYLRSAPFDKIKIDSSFVESCTATDQNSAKIIAAILSLSSALGMETTVEGVEAFDQLDVVREKGAELIQGFIYSKALKREEISEGLANGEFRIEPQGPSRYRAERRTVFRRIGVIHHDHRYEVVMRDLSMTGAAIEGLVAVPVGTGLVLDLGGGQLAVCVVTRSENAMIAVEFETPMVSDGAGGLCTRHRVSPYALAAAGMPLAALPAGQYPIALKVHSAQEPTKFMHVAAAGSRG